MALRKISDVPLLRTLIGPKGSDGKDGRDGKDGKDGVTTVVTDVKALEEVKRDLELAIQNLNDKIEKIKKRRPENYFPGGIGGADPTQPYTWTGVQTYDNHVYFEKLQDVPSLIKDLPAYNTVSSGGFVASWVNDAVPDLPPFFYGYRAEGTPDNPLPITNGADIVIYSGFGMRETQYRVGGTIKLEATEDWSSTGDAHGCTWRIDCANKSSTGGTTVVYIRENEVVVPGISCSTLQDYADDTAAAAGGVEVGSFYRTGSVVKVRVS